MLVAAAASLDRLDLPIRATAIPGDTLRRSHRIVRRLAATDCAETLLSKAA
jgi:hypothetical protein